MSPRRLDPRRLAPVGLRRLGRTAGRIYGALSRMTFADWRGLVRAYGRLAAFALGLVALAAVAVLLSPVAVPGVVLLLPAGVVPLLALVAAGYGVKVIATARGSRPERAAPPTDDEASDAPLVGADIDAAFEALAAEDEGQWSADNAERVLRSELRRTAAMALESRGHPPEEAERLLDAGAWTDDRRAAAFLGDGHLPLRTRVRDWASGEPIRRRAEAAVEALAELTDPADEMGEGPDREPADAVLGGIDAGGVATVERTAELEPEVDA